jgi:hypothetical protein
MRRTKPRDLPYKPRQSLLSRGELAFYQVLRRSLRGSFGISIKTRLADIVECPRNLWDSPGGWRVSQKHVDFVLYDRNTTRIVAVIELDDRSHFTAERQRRDRFLNEVLKVAGVTLLRVRAAARYRVADLREQFRGILGETIPRAVSNIDAKDRVESL